MQPMLCRPMMFNADANFRQADSSTTMWKSVEEKPIRSKTQCFIFLF